MRIRRISRQKLLVLLPLLRVRVCRRHHTTAKKLAHTLRDCSANLLVQLAYIIRWRAVLELCRAKKLKV